ncbi:MAG: amidohydrolase family protein [Candidatus Doudnabacteria bacterium]|nr:amidohydrolase family protein [Candidatus Doudnabacteria bacterium]
MAEILIKNGTVVDGVSKVSKKADVLVAKGKIVDIGPNLNPKAKTIINAKDCFVTPGFVDIQNHSDSYLTLLEQPEQSSLLTQGITTIVVGNCGSSLAPLPSREAIKSVQKWHNLAGVNINWDSFEEFLVSLSGLKLGVNVASLVGHATIRRGLIGDQARKLSEEEVRVLEKLLKAALDQGAIGLSLGLVYAHEVDSSADELIRLAKIVKQSGKYLSVHLRSETANITESIDEAIFLAAQTGVKVKISHLKIRGPSNWHLFEHVLNKIENAYHQGIDISFDVYPYSSTWAVLYTYLPKWAYEGGRAQISRHLASGVDRRKILDYLRHQELGFERIVIASASGNKAFVGKSIAQIAKNQSVSGEEALINLLSGLEGSIIVFDHNLSDEQVELFVSSPLSVIATDGAGYSRKTEDLVHPRCFGAIPKFLQMVREKKLMTWEQAVRKITSEPARIAGLDLGVISKDKAADLVVFNPNEIVGKADYNYPNQLPVGIKTVLVSGVQSVEGNMLHQAAGRVIRK